MPTSKNQVLRIKPKPPQNERSESAPEQDDGGSFAVGTLTTLARGLRVLEYVVKSARLVRLRDVAEAFDMDRSAALRFLRTLEHEGFVTKHESIKAYSIGPKLLTLPRLAPIVEQLIERVRPALVDLAKQTGQWSHLAILQDTRAILVEIVPSDARVAVKQAVGDLEPLYTSAVGKAIYSFLPEAERRGIGAKLVFNRLTDRTLRSVNALEKEARIIRDTRVAFDRGEGNEQVTCIASPILDAQGYPKASIGISIVAAHLDGPVDEERDSIELVKKAARNIERSLFRSGASD